MKKHPLIKAALLVLIIAAVVFGAYFGNRLYMEERINQGFFIGKVPVGGLTRQEAVLRLSTFEADEILDRLPALVLEEDRRQIRYEFKPSQAGLVLLPEESVDRVMQISQREGYLGRLSYGLGRKRSEVPPVMKVANELHLKALVAQVSAYVDRGVENAKFLVEKDPSGRTRVSIKPHTTGRQLKREETRLLLKSSLEKGAGESAIVLDLRHPMISEEMLRSIPSPEVIGSYTTYYGTHDSPNRISNIYLVSSFVDNTFLASGEVFSLLPLIGEFTGERGFKEAYVIIGEELVPEYGGGACQIATTLYNSALMADLEIVNRRNHGMYFSIYPLGRDATIYPPSTDLKLRNNTGHPVVIQAVPFKKGLTFRIIGAPSGKTVSFSPASIRYRYETAATKDPTSEVREEKLVPTGAFWTTVTRTVKKNGAPIKKETIKSYYKLHGDKKKVKIRRREPR